MEPPGNSRITLTFLATVTVGMVAVIALGALLYIKGSAIPGMNLASWGTFLVGVVGMFASILVGTAFWLVKRALDQQAHELGRLAFALERQSAAFMATHEPALESSTLLLTDDHEGRLEDRIELTLINTGGDARDLKIYLCGMESRPVDTTHDDKKVQRHPSLTQGNPPWVTSWTHYNDGGLEDTRPEGFLVARYRDVHGIEHELKFEVHWTRSPYTVRPFSPSKHGILLRV